VLGICYGMQLMCQALGGQVRSAPAREYGRAELTVDSAKQEAADLFAGVAPHTQVWMSHGDQVDQVSEQFSSIAATGTWYGGWLDELIQRITEVNLVLPFLAVLIMVGTFYSRSIWLMLGVTILLSIFSGSIKTYRAIFMQSKEAGYIEAARAYGASSSRIIFSYLIPRMIPLLIPALVSSVPSFVFLEASLAVLGLGDPVLPTWGKVINDAFTDGALYQGRYYWVLEPAVLLMITGLGFAMLGFALDRIFNPRLRDI